MGPFFQNRLLPRYMYNFTPPQLMFLCEALERTRNLPGPVLEIGCAGGFTTLFLNRYMDSMRIEKPYVCIDTFGGFTEADVAVELGSRGKQAGEYGRLWTDWSKELFEQTMRLNRVSRVRTIQADINELDTSPLGAPSMCLVDVDLYRPVTSALQKVYPAMAGGGMIIVDDCAPNSKYDGALQAYTDFTRERGLPLRLTLDKLGVIDLTYSRPNGYRHAHNSRTEPEFEV